MTTDHGGKARAARKPVHGAERVARFFLGVVAKAERWNLPHAGALAYVNGAPALLVHNGEGGLETIALLNIERTPEGPRITSISAVRNPDKLAAVARELRLAVQARA
jgi:RNA polymerase sigma-70 factor (ECF subfamily)